MSAIGFGKRRARQAFVSTLALVAGVLASSHSLAQENSCSALAPNYPQRSPTFIVPFPAGAQSDLIGRLIADGLSRRLGKTVVVENKSGAGGNIGAAAAAKAEPDGYTILLAAISGFAIGPSVYKTKLFDHVKDFSPVAFLVEAPQVFLANKDFTGSSTADLIKLAKEKPGKLNLALPGSGTLPHIAAEQFKSSANVDITNVIYRGGAPAMNDLLSGQVDVYIDAIMTAVPQVKAGSVRALAVTGRTRSPLLPDVAAVNEVLPGYEMYAWWGVAVPARTPDPIVQRLNCEINALLSEDKLVKRFSEMGATPNKMSQAEFGAFIASETEKYKKIAERSNISVE